jgi:hypothetical protein
MGRKRKNISEQRNAMLSIAVTAERKRQLQSDAAACGETVSSHVNRLIFAPASRRAQTRAVDLERLSALRHCASALDDLSRATLDLTGPANLLEIHARLMQIERAIMTVAFHSKDSSPGQGGEEVLVDDIEEEPFE